MDFPVLTELIRLIGRLKEKHKMMDQVSSIVVYLYFSICVSALCVDQMTVLLTEFNALRQIIFRNSMSQMIKSVYPYSS